MKWNGRVSNGQKRYIEYLSKLPEEKITKILVDIDSEENQYVHSSGWTILWCFEADGVEMVCEDNEEYHFIKTTCQQILRDKKINTLLDGK